MPPYHGCPGPSTFFSYLLCIYPYFFTFTYTFKKISLDAPSLDARGRRTPRHPLLHATVDRCLVRPVCAVACRRSWMHGANEVLGCPQVKKDSINSSAKISDDPF